MEGRLEVCYSGVWGTVCNINWNKIDAEVVCKQLGHSSLGINCLMWTSSPRLLLISKLFQTHPLLNFQLFLGATVLTVPFIQTGSGSIFLDRVACTGEENRLWDCVFSGPELNTCVHSQDAGVRCIAGSYLGNHQLLVSHS